MVPVASSVGATDFVVEGSSAEEAEIRLRLASRVSKVGERPMSADQPGIKLHWQTHEISFEGTTIPLTLREMQLLSALLERSGEVVTADELARRAWGKGTKVGSGLAAAYVCSLRKKLAWFGGRFGIQTQRGAGYRFVM